MATVITDITELQAMENDLTADYELFSDIDASATSSWNEDAENPGTYFGFDPIGSSGSEFTGSFDGKGYKITDLAINRPTENFVGLFGYTDESGEIKNVGLENCSISGKQFVGALIGFQDTGCGEISNCWSTGTMDAVLGSVGGLMSYNYGAGVEDCYSTCTVTCTGGATGDATECGGLIGNVVAAITRCYATGNVTATSDSDVDLVGGFAGFGNPTTDISRCYATGDISVTAGGRARETGGFVGSYSAGYDVIDCYARGDVAVTVVDNSWGGIGGFVGVVGDVTADITNCYSTGSITETDGMPDIGGFCGDNLGTITNCFWDTQTSGTATSDGGTGKTTAQMKTEATFTDAGWDFDTIWDIDAVANNGYPSLGDVGTAPTVTTQAVSVIAAETATGNGNVTALGDPSPIAHGVCYNTTGSPTVADSTTDEGAAAATGAFTSSMTGLSINTKYYVKAYASNAEGTSYGSEVNFTTLGVPTVITETCESVVGATSTGRGEITVIGNPTPTAHGHCWHTSADPTTANGVVDNGAASVIGTFISSITGLTPGTAYYTRAYATNTQGTVYGANVYFVAPTTGTTGRAGYTWDEDSNLRSFDANALERQYIHTGLFDANTILAANTDDTPAALTIAEQRIVGRITSGNIAGLTAAQVATLVQGSIDHGSIAGLTDDDHTQYTLKSLFDAANTILKADVQATPEGLTVAEQRLVGRITDGVITALTPAQVMALLSGQAGATFSLNAQDLSYVGHIGLGNVAADADFGIYHAETFVIDDNSERISILSNISGYKTSAAYETYMAANEFAAFVNALNTQNWTDPVGLRGVYGLVGTYTGSAAPSTITGAASFYADADVPAAANDMVLTNYYGLYVAARALVGADKLTNCYGVKVEDQEGGATLNYAIHTGAGLVHFGDNLDLAASKTVDGIDIKTIQTRALMFALCS